MVFRTGNVALRDHAANGEDFQLPQAQPNSLRCGRHPVRALCVVISLVFVCVLLTGCGAEVENSSDAEAIARAEQAQRNRASVDLLVMTYELQLVLGQFEPLESFAGAEFLTPGFVKTQRNALIADGAALQARLDRWRSKYRGVDPDLEALAKHARILVSNIIRWSRTGDETWLYLAGNARKRYNRVVKRLDCERARLDPSGC